jgi:formate hydrogenlyase subunit 6/NADH:ubiquinone oxidoreductase subunit I
MEVFKMQFYMTCMFSRETSLYVLNMNECVYCRRVADAAGHIGARLYEA